MCCAAVSSAGGWLPCCAVRVAVRPFAPLVPCSPVPCSMALCCRVVLWFPALLPCLFFLFVCWFAFSYFKNHHKICLQKKGFFRLLKIKYTIVHYATRTPAGSKTMSASRPYM